MVQCNKMSKYLQKLKELLKKNDEYIFVRSR